jgi:RHS repeat-associated protein
MTPSESRLNAAGAPSKTLSGAKLSVGGAFRAASRLAVADANGNLAALVDADPASPLAAVLETVDYEPFGRVLTRRRPPAAGPIPAQAEPLCPFGFSSRYVDTDTGLVYFGYRHYNPDTGRWLCRDPLQEPGGPNLYAYCQNDPINLIDPLGLFNLPTHVNVTISAIRKLKGGIGLSDAQFSELLRGAVEGSMYPDLQARPRVPQGTPIRTLQTADFTLGFPSRVAGEGAAWAGEKIATAQTWAIGLVWSDYPRIQMGLKYWWEDSSAIVPAVDFVSRYYPATKVSPLYQTHYGDQSWQHSMSNGQSATSIQSSLIEGTRACLAEFRTYASQGNTYDAGFALGTALHYLQDTHTPSHVQRSAVTGLIEAFHDYNQQSPALHSTADKPDWRGSRDPVYSNAVRQTQAMVQLFLGGNAEGVGGFFETIPGARFGIPGRSYGPRPGVVDPIAWIRALLD